MIVSLSAACTETAHTKRRIATPARFMRRRLARTNPPTCDLSSIAIFLALERINPRCDEAIVKPRRSRGSNVAGSWRARRIRGFARSDSNNFFPLSGKQGERCRPHEHRALRIRSVSGRRPARNLPHVRDGRDSIRGRKAMTATSQQMWHYDRHNPTMTPALLFEGNLAVIEHAIAQVCRQVRLNGADAEDFASTARLALLEDDCAILRKYEGRSSMSSYLAIVIRRLFISQKRAEGRWHPSAEATRRGEAAVTLDRLFRYEGRPLAESLAITKNKHPDADV